MIWYNKHKTFIIKKVDYGEIDKMKKWKTFKVITLLFSIFLSACSRNTPVNPEDRFFNFYYLNDTHGAFKRQNTDTNYNEAGMAYISSYLKEKYYADPQNTIILSGGDMFQGGFESNATKGSIMVDAMNEIGFDAMVLGNHEFDWGEEALISIADKLDCPIISCNTFYRGTEEIPEYIQPCVVVEKNDLRVGIIGAIEQDINSSITGSVSQNFSFPDPTPYVKTWSRLLRTESNCDLVIAAFHDGGFDGNNFKYRSLCDIDSMTRKGYVDGIFLAHDHRYKSGYHLGVPYLESGCNGRYIGNMKFELKLYDDEYTDNKYAVVNSWCENTGAYKACVNEDQVVKALVNKYAAEIEAGDEVIYTFKNDYSRDQFAVVVCEAMYWYVNENKDFFGGHEIYLASHNTGGIRVAVTKGPMKLSQIIAVCPFDNNIYIQKCTEENIDYIRSNYAYYDTNEIVYEGGYTYAATNAYVAENETYSRYLHVEAWEYQITAKDILIEYLKQNINPNL